MDRIKVSHLVALSAFCWIALTWFQVKWVIHAKNLSEEQFDQKVSMALCAVVSELDSASVATCSDPMYIDTAFPVSLDSTFFEATNEALAFYDIYLPYEIRLGKSESSSCDPSSPYCCVITPFATEDGALLSIAFQGKNKYLLGQHWPMLGASVILLLCILFVFVVTFRALIRQKKMSQWNIDFFNNMAHEFRTPITNIKLAMQRLVKTRPELENNKYVQVVLSEDEKLTSEVNGILSMAQWKNGRDYLDLKPIELTDIIQNLVKEMTLQIQAANAKVKIDEPGEPIIVYGDPFHLMIAFRNIIDNALKFNTNSPQIVIRIFQRDRQAIVQFEDNGIGIANQQRELIFKKYHQTENGKRVMKNGYGLGLSYVQRVIKDHNGLISVHDNLQKGSRFELILPTS